MIGADPVGFLEGRPACWGGRGLVARWFDMLEIWRGYARDVTGFPIDAGHFIAEERPQETARALLEFLAA